MGIFDNIASALGYAPVAKSTIKKMSVFGGSADDDDDGAPSRGPRAKKNFEAWAQAYKDSGWVFAPLNKIANSASMVPLRFYIEDENGEVVEEIKAHEVKKLIEKPFAGLTRMDLIFAISAYLKICGKAYLLILPNVTKPEQLVPIRPDKIEPIKDAKGMIVGWDYKPNGTSIKYPVEQVIPIRTFDPTDINGGVGAIEASKTAILLDEIAVLSNQRFLMNDGSPGGVITQPDNPQGTPLDESALNRYKRFWDRNFSGVKNKNRTAILPPGWNYEKVSLDAQEMQYLESRKAFRDELLASMDVPPGLAGILEYANYSNMDAQERYFWKYTIEPLLRKIEISFNMYLLEKYNKGQTKKILKCEFDLSKYLPEDLELKARVDEILLRTGQRTINELRKRDKLEEVMWGNTWWVSGMYVPVETLMAQASNPTPAPANEPPKNPDPNGGGGLDTGSANSSTEPGDDGSNTNTPEPPTEPGGGAGNNVNKVQKSAYQNQPVELEYDSEELDYIAKFDAKTKKIENKAIPVLVDTFNLQESAILGKLKQSTKKVAKARGEKFDELMKSGMDPEQARIQVQKDLPFDVEAILGTDDLTQAMVDAMGPIFIEAVSTGAMDLVSRHDIGLSFDINNPGVSKFIRAKVMEFVNVINGTTYDRVKAGLEAGIDAGETEQELAERVRHAFDGRRNNASTIARTEIGESYNFGHYSVGSQAHANGLLTKKKWITAQDERVRDAHVKAHRQEKAIDEPFDVGGDQMMFPLDRDSGASASNVINCRCIARYLP